MRLGILLRKAYYADGETNMSSSQIPQTWQISKSLAAAFRQDRERR